MTVSIPKVAVACQGGGTHGAFEVGVLSEILKDMETRRRFDLVGLSGTSAGALCAMMIWYGLAPKKGRQGSGSIDEAIKKINTFWDGFAASTPAEIMHNAFCSAVLGLQEQEVPGLGINMPIFGLNPRGVLDDAVLWELRQLGAREEHYDFDAMLKAACPEFDDIDWRKVNIRVLLGASEIVDGVETVFDFRLQQDCAVGTVIAAAPRSDPGERNYRTGLLPWVMTLNRTSGRGWRRRAGGSHRSVSCIGLDMIGQVSDLGVRLRASDRSDQQAAGMAWLC